MVIGLLSKSKAIHETRSQNVLSDLLAALRQPSFSDVDIPLELSLDIRDDLEIPIFNHIVVDSIPVVYRIPTYAFRGHGMHHNVCSPFLHGGPLPSFSTTYRPPILFLLSWYMSMLLLT